MENLERLRAVQFFSRFAENFEMDQLAEFIKNNDMKSIANNNAYKALQDALDKEIFYLLEAGTTLYRSRAIDFRNGLFGIEEKNIDGQQQFTGYDELASGAPPLGLSQPGRSNISGASYLYLAEDEYTACSEIKPDYQQYVSVAKYVTNVPLKIVDFSSLPSDGKDLPSIQLQAYFSVYRECFECPAYSSDVYLVPQFFAEMVRKNGYDGICYRSHYSGKKNYTLFHFSEKYIQYNGSRPLFVSHGALRIHDINAYCDILPPNEPKMPSSDVIRKILLRQIKEETPNG